VSVSTHVLDNARGEPAAGVPVRLEFREKGEWTPTASGVTDSDGRLRDWATPIEWQAGEYRLVFDTATYLGPAAFFPEVVVVFAIADPDRHYHVPLLLSPYGYTTYRGS
jgi:5-hydroxyisourate hydrolase